MICAEILEEVSEYTHRLSEKAVRYSSGMGW